MTDVLITVAEMPAKPATRKTHSIVDTTGKYWDVWPEKIGMFHIGGTYRITDFASREFNGKTYYTIKKAEISKQQNTDFSPGNIGNPGQLTPTPHPPPIMQPPTMAQYNEAEEIRNCNIHINVVVGHTLQNPNVNPLTLTLVDRVRMIQEAERAWMNTRGKRYKSAALDDEIPL